MIFDSLLSKGLAIGLAASLAVNLGMGLGLRYLNGRVDTLKTEKIEAEKSRDKAISDAKACSDSIKSFQDEQKKKTDEANAELARLRAQDEAIQKRITDILLRQPMKGDTSKGFCDSADALLNDQLGN